MTITGGQLREIRKKCGLSQMDLARALGMSREQIGRIERGDYPVSTTLELALKQALGITIKKHAKRYKPFGLFSYFDIPTTLKESTMHLTINPESQRREIATLIFAQLFHRSDPRRPEDLDNGARASVRAADALLAALKHAAKERPLDMRLPTEPGATYPLPSTDDMRAAILAYNEVIRSAFSIAFRDGVDTNWSGFRDTVNAVLNRHHETFCHISSDPYGKLGMSPTPDYRT